MIISKKSLPRRTFLRGAGTLLALPLLDAIAPASTPRAAKAVVRLIRLRSQRNHHGQVDAGQ
jgi:hypothetical protein